VHARTVLKVNRNNGEDMQNDASFLATIEHPCVPVR